MEITDILICAQLACVLEVSAPKPGNVNRYHDFEDTKYEHFLASGILIGKSSEKAATRGYKAGVGKLAFSNIGIGELIKEAILDASRWHSGGNTNLGIAMLLIPLSAAYGAAIGMKNTSKKMVRRNIAKMITESTYTDSLALYEAIKLAKPGGMGSVEKLDVFKKDSLMEIEKEKINLYQLMRIAKGDSIARELATSMEISFEIGLPALVKEYAKNKEIEAAIVNAYLKILSEVPDTLIARKNGYRVAEEVSRKAKNVLAGTLSIEKFDRYLRGRDNRLNPGTTADLVTSSLMIALLRGVRP